MPNNHIFDEQVGLLKTGTITGYDSTRGLLKVKLNNASSIKGQSQSIDVPAPHSLFYNNGLFIGTLPVTGTPIVVGQGSGGQYYFVSFLAENLPIVPNLNSGELLIRSNDDTKISINTNYDINIGSPDNKIHINTKSNLISTNFYNENHFTQASRKIDGLIKRDLKINTNFGQEFKLENDAYDSKLYVIGLDPTVTPNPIITSSNKNPPLVEQREIIYEFQYSSEINDDLNESLLYGNTKPPATSFTFPNRRKSRSDTLSLTLAAPNYLMETIKGTVVDIFGNILDINRAPLPIGKDQNTLRTLISTDKIKSYQLIRELERKSIALHFELNARKNLSVRGTDQFLLPDINSNSDYARERSRFFFDVDKEGTFKFNAPSSSENGNIHLLTRYENYSTFGPEDNNNYNKLIFRDDNLDIFHDSFAAPRFNINDGTFATDKGSIKLDSNGADAAPIDRITESHIKHGTAYHDILATCYAHQKPDFLKYVADDTNPVFSKNMIDQIPLITNIAKDVLITSGENANAGGRSGSFNCDGSLEINVGANTSDRHSLWLDTAGAMLVNVGRDLNNMSAALSMNGDVFIQIGGMGVSTDSRFIKQNNGQIGAALDIRVFNSGLRVTMIRVDNEGVKILTPGNLSIHAGQNMRITADADIVIDCETLTLQNRMVLKEFGGSI